MSEPRSVRRPVATPSVYDGQWPQPIPELATGVLFGWVWRTKRRLYGVVYISEQRFRGGSTMTWKFPKVTVLK